VSATVVVSAVNRLTVINVGRCDAGNALTTIRCYEQQLKGTKCRVYSKVTRIVEVFFILENQKSLV